MAVQRPISFSTTARRQVQFQRRLPGWFVLLPAFVTLALGLLLYQLPAKITVPIGSAGDQLFLDGSEALDAAATSTGSWYADELSEAGRSRWTRGRARITFPDVGGGDAEVTLRAQGWPPDVLHGGQRQPNVTVKVGDEAHAVVVSQFPVTAQWQEYRFQVPAAARSSAGLALQLDVSDVFTRTRQFSDVRPKGIRVDRVTLELERPASMRRTGWSALLGLAGSVLLATLALRRRTPRAGLATFFGAGLSVAGVTALWLWRAWAATLAPFVLLAAVLLVLLATWDDLRRLVRMALVRLRMGSALTYAGIVTMVVAALGLLATTLTSVKMPSMPNIRGDSDRLIQMLPPLVLTGVLLAAGPTVMPDVLRSLRRRLLHGWLPPLLLGLAGAGILAWELQLLRELPFVGHADYADNAVVARSLIRGQGWTVPYVTQFYQLTPDGSVYRPQETWPLLQPVWMAPWMALFGPTAFAARISNLVFNAVLLLLVYHIGATIWDRRVGLLAAALTLLNYWMWKYTVFSTSDLGFTALSMAALYLFFRAWEASTGPADARRRVARASGLPGWWRRPGARWAAAGIVTGLMTLQKPSGAIFGVAMGLWALIQCRRAWSAEQGQGNPQAARLPIAGLGLWAGLAALVISPYIGRNLLLFGKPVFSTESYDAWLLGYKGKRAEAGEEIYRIYLRDLPNRSWILRWGWDRTFNKLINQFDAVRAYLFPPSGALLGHRDYQGTWLGISLSAITPTWLWLLGLLTLRRRQRALLGLVALAGGLYVLFLVTYWHADEERYFVPFIPWLLLLAMAALCAAFDRVLLYRGGRWAGLAGGLIVLLLWSTLQPQLARIDAFLDPASNGYWGKDWQPDLAAFDWLKAHTRPDEVVMTRVPWQLSFAADRPSLMIPNAPLESGNPQKPSIMQAARYYGADYLLVNAMNGPGAEAQEGLAPLSKGTEALGFKLVYSGAETPGRKPVYIYRFPADYNGARPLQP